ncbi:hypothetical protein P692DRAFT_20819652 [Suillus brevipes Sb2]|nr:hypothetical protein P692DRAFT_20819652 [Suillus brevipes Sb2]
MEVNVQMAITNGQLIGRINHLESQLGEVQSSIKSLQESRNHHAVRLVTQNAKLSTQKQEATSEVENLRVDMLAMEQRMVALLNEKFGEVNSGFAELNSTNALVLKILKVSYTYVQYCNAY